MFFCLLALVSLVGCGGPRSGDGAGKEENIVPSRSIDEVLATHAESLLARTGVTIVYQGATEEGAPCIVVGVVDAAVVAEVLRKMNGSERERSA